MAEPHAPALRPVLSFALRGLLRRPVQTGLLFFALSIALGSSLTILAVLSGIRVQMEEDLEQVGLDVVNVHLGLSLQSFLSSPLRAADLEEFRRLSGGVVAPFLAGMAVGTAAGDEESAQFLVLTTTPEWSTVVPLEFTEGSFFTGADPGACVLDEWVASRLFPGGAAGATLRLQQAGGPRELRVAGVLRDPFEIRKKFEELDVAASARSRMLRMMEFKSVYVPGDFSDPGAAIHGAVIKVGRGEDPSVVEDRIVEYLGDRYGEVAVWARKEWADAVLAAGDLALRLANVIWIVVLLVTGIMIATVSLVAIRERFGEIAVRRTEGALRSQVALQLLCENLLLSMAAGAAAILFSRLAGDFLAERYLSWPPAYLWLDTALALGLGFGLAAAATALPAVRAASLQPVEILHRGGAAA